MYFFARPELLKVFKQQTIFPYYHLISDKDITHIKQLYHFKDVSTFKKDLFYLLKNYEPLDFKKLLNSNDTNRVTLPENKFLLTFDDGLRQCYDVIFPILQAKNIKAVFFINPHFIDNKNMLHRHLLSALVQKLPLIKDTNVVDKLATVFNTSFTSDVQMASLILKIPETDTKKLDIIMKILDFNKQTYLAKEKPYLTTPQIKEMISRGHYFGGHTMTHPRLCSLSQKKQVLEIITSIEWVKKEFYLEYSLFAFPFTDRGISKQVIQNIFDYDPNTLLFGNAGIKKDISDRIFQRFSLDSPDKEIQRVLVTENLYKFYNKLTFKHKIKRD